MAPASPDARALVLGGGGSAGNAWEIGLLAGLHAGGAGVTSADLTIGTSAGATAAAQITSRRSPADLYTDILDSETALGAAGRAADGAPGTRGAGSSGRRTDAGPNFFEVTGEIIAASSDPADMRRRMGAAALAAETPESHARIPERRATVAGRLPTREWPAQRLWITAIDARTGEPLVLDRESGVPLADAVTASCANGFGPFPPHEFGGRRYIDGGWGTAENPQYATGFGRVLVLSPFGGRSRVPLDWGLHLSAQAERLRAGGSRVEIIGPDAAAREAFGGNMMNLAARPPAARAGYAHGLAIAARIAAERG